MTGYESPYIEYKNDDNRVFIARPVLPDEYPSVQRIRQQDLERRLVEPGYATAREVRSYIRVIESKSGMGEPGDSQRLGLFHKDGDGERMVAFQEWGIDTHEPHEETRALLAEALGELAIAGMSDEEINTYAEQLTAFQKGGDTYEYHPKTRTLLITALGERALADTPDEELNTYVGYVENRHAVINGEGWGNTIRHASAVAMRRAGLVIVGQSLPQLDMRGYVSENAKLKPKYLLRRDSAVPIKSSGDPRDPRRFAFDRTQIYVTLDRLTAYLEQKHDFLAKGRKNAT